DQLLDTNRIAPERVSEVELERGKLLYQAGERDLALASFHRAMDAMPSEEQDKNHGQLFADLLAFLVQRGELEESVDTYHRALAQNRLLESLKVYCSLWINDLLQRNSQPPDPLALAFLQSVQGGKWHAELARWALGQLNAQELQTRADTPGKQAEAAFYLSM